LPVPGGPEALRDHTLEAHLACRLQNARAVGIEGLCEAHAPALVPREDLLERRAALPKGDAAKIAAVEVEQVEDEVSQAFRTARVERVLHRIEVRNAVLAQHDDRAVEPGGLSRQRPDFEREARHPRRPEI
jgi:hypothetical protein